MRRRNFPTAVGNVPGMSLCESVHRDRWTLLLRATVLSALAAAATACVPQPGDSTDTEGTTVDGPDTGPGTEGPVTSGSSSETTGGESSAETTTDPASSGDAESTGGEHPLCASYCAKLTGCGTENSAWCAESCQRAVVEYGYIGEGCLDIFADYASCIEGHTCEEITGDPNLCEEKLDAVFTTTACVTPGCAATCAKILECGEPKEDPSHCGVDCSFGLGGAAANFGEACADAYEKAQLCVGTQTCEALEAPTPCPDAYAEADAICGV